jgi:hypothetical protein
MSNGKLGECTVGDLRAIAEQARRDDEYLKAFAANVDANQSVGMPVSRKNRELRKVIRECVK